MDSRIGTLSNGKFYAFLNDYDAEPTFTDTLEEIEALLKGEVFTPAPKAKLTKKTSHSYIVSVTPEMTVYASGFTGSEYTVEVYASTAAEAIKEARSQRRDSEGRFGVKCSYKAKRV